jgi:hypothetical protein
LRNPEDVTLLRRRPLPVEVEAAPTPAA